MQTEQNGSKSLALFATCLVDQIYPQIGVAITKVLKRTGYKVDFPPDQTCCGQPFYNSGFVKESKKLAQRTIEIFSNYSAVVLPSGSCTTMIRKEYPHLFEDDPVWLEKAIALSAKTYEFTEFLVKKTELPILSPMDGQVITYHDSCHMLRNLGIKDEPRILLKKAGFQIIEMDEPDRCCGFGGLFSAKNPEVSQAMTGNKISRALRTKAEVLVSSDPGCMMQMRNNLSEGSSLKIMHIAEVLEEVSA